MAPVALDVCVPEGVTANDVFLVICPFTMRELPYLPAGCTVGAAIGHGRDLPNFRRRGSVIAARRGGRARRLLAWNTFTVDHDGRTFVVGVPDGCAPGGVIVVEVPSAARTLRSPSSSPTRSPQW